MGKEHLGVKRLEHWVGTETRRHNSSFDRNARGEREQTREEERREEVAPEEYDRFHYNS